MSGIKMFTKHNVVGTSVFLVTPADLADPIMSVVREMVGVDDDAGFDWLTIEGNTFIGGANWLASNNPDVAVLVNAANILRCGHALTLTKDMIDAQLAADVE